MVSSRKRRGGTKNSNPNNGTDAGKLIRENVKCPVCMEVSSHILIASFFCFVQISNLVFVQLF